MEIKDIPKHWIILNEMELKNKMKDIPPPKHNNSYACFGPICHNLVPYYDSSGALGCGFGVAEAGIINLDTGDKFKTLQSGNEDAYYHFKYLRRQLVKEFNESIGFMDIKEIEARD